MIQNIVQITRVKPVDVKELQEISRQTFFETFAMDNTESDMQKYLDDELTVDKLMDEIENPAIEIYFARTSHQPAGYLTLHFSNDATELPGHKGLKIERLYILQKWQGKKLGQILLDFTTEIAIKHLVDYLWLGVWERNFKAIGFYEKNGFVKSGSTIFMLGDDQQTDFIMKKYLPVI